MDSQILILFFGLQFNTTAIYLFVQIIPALAIGFFKLSLASSKQSNFFKCTIHFLLVYVFSKLCNHHCYLITEHFHHPQNIFIIPVRFFFLLKLLLTPTMWSFFHTKNQFSNTTGCPIIQNHSDTNSQLVQTPEL